MEQKPADKVETNLLTVERAKKISPFMRSGFENESASWSEEDENMITDLSIIIHTYFSEISGVPFKYDLSEDKIRTWLKALKDRYTWKPSDEQIGLLQAIVNDPNNASSESCQIVLKEVIRQLKKLKE